MAFTSIIKSESKKENEKVENLEQTNISQEDEEDIQEAYDQLLEESLKLKRLNRSTFKKLHDLELEKERPQLEVWMSWTLRKCS